MRRAGVLAALLALAAPAVAAAQEVSARAVLSPAVATIGEVFPDAIASPYVMMAATDARHFTAICDRVYRFAPFRMSKPQRQAIHSYDEHLGVDTFVDGVRWYQRLIERIPPSG